MEIQRFVLETAALTCSRRIARARQLLFFLLTGPLQQDNF